MARKWYLNLHKTKNAVVSHPKVPTQSCQQGCSACWVTWLGKGTLMAGSHMSPQHAGWVMWLVGMPATGHMTGRGGSEGGGPSGEIEEQCYPLECRMTADLFGIKHTRPSLKHRLLITADQGWIRLQGAVLCCAIVSVYSIIRLQTILCLTRSRRKKRMLGDRRVPRGHTSKNPSCLTCRNLPSCFTVHLVNYLNAIAGGVTIQSTRLDHLTVQGSWFGTIFSTKEDWKQYPHNV